MDAILARVLGLLLGLLLFASPAWASSLVSGTLKQSTTGNTVTSDAIDTTGANLLVVAISGTGTGSTLSDSKSNTWTNGTEVGSGSGSSIRLYYVFSPTVGSGHTFTATGTANYPTIMVLALAGMTSFDAETTGTGNPNPVTTVAPGSQTPGANNTLFVVALTGNYASGVASIDAGFTIEHQAALVSGKAYAGAIAYYPQNTAAAIHPTWTAPSSSYLATAMMSFRGTAWTGAARLRSLLGVGQ